ncbi:MAG: hypothetical protein AB1499_03850 [Nitrospirota bacterium]
MTEKLYLLYLGKGHECIGNDLLNFMKPSILSFDAYPISHRIIKVLRQSRSPDIYHNKAKTELILTFPESKSEGFKLLKFLKNRVIALEVGTPVFSGSSGCTLVTCGDGNYYKFNFLAGSDPLY